MNPKNDGIRHNKNNNDGRTKGIAAAITMSGIVVAAALLSGLFSINSYYQPAIAQQQNMTGGAAGGNATTGAAGGNMSEVRLQLEEARTALQNNDTQGAMMNLDLALNTLGGAAGAQGNMTSTAGGNATNATTTTVGGDQVSEEEGGRIELEEERAQGENESPGQSPAEESP
ncbi:MAG: hypothetical protein ACJ70O_08265 [Nitrososphaera sp.]